MQITDEALEAAVELSDRYITGRCLPDKAIDVIDEAGARVRLKAMTRPPDLKEHRRADRAAQPGEGRGRRRTRTSRRPPHLRDQADKLKKKKETITREWREKSKEVDGVVDEEVDRRGRQQDDRHPAHAARRRRRPPRLLKMEDELHKKVISQDEAIKRDQPRPSAAAAAGLKDPKRPIGSFIFAGPTGVGKTLLAKALAEFMFGDDDALIQIDMSRVHGEAQRLAG